MRSAIIRLTHLGSSPDEFEATLGETLGGEDAEELLTEGVVPLGRPLSAEAVETLRSSPSGAAIEYVEVDDEAGGVVFGDVVATGTARRGVEVRLYDGAVTGEEEFVDREALATDRTGNFGEYVLAYDRSALRATRDRRATVVVAAGDGERLLTTGDAIESPRPVERHDVDLGDTALGEEAPGRASVDDEVGEDPVDPTEDESDDGAESEAPEPSPARGEDVFRMMTVRSPESADSRGGLFLDPKRSAGLLDDLLTVRDADDPQSAALETLVEFENGSQFVHSLADLGVELEAIRSVLRTDPPESSAAFADLVTAELGVEPATLVDRDEFEEAEARLTDSLVATALYPATTSLEHAADLRDAVRVVEAIRRVAERPESVRPADILSQSVLLPAGVEPLPALPTGSDDERSGARPTGDVGTLANRLSALQRARDELHSAVEDHALSADLHHADGDGSVEGLHRTVRRALERESEGPLATAGEREDQSMPEADPSPLTGADDPDERLGHAFAEISELVDRLQAGPTLDERVTEERLLRLSDASRALVDELGVTPAETTVSDALSRLDAEATTANEELLRATVGAYERLLVTDDGLTMVADGLEYAGGWPPFADSIAGADARRHRPGVTALGFGELEVVKQVGPEYEAGEIAHVENVMRSESRERVHEESTVTEETTRREEETTSSETEDLQTTQRNELKREAETVIEEQSDLEAGVSVSAKYGAVTVDANFGYSRQNARRDARRTAVTTAKEITQRATRNVEKRVRTETIRRVREEVTERNSHAFDNAGPEHITGVYRWLDKTYRMDVHEFDEPRLMVEFVIPDPAATYRQAARNRPAARSMEKPVEPQTVKFAGGDVDDGPDLDAENAPVYLEPLTYGDLTPENYRWYAAHYGAEGVPEPPEATVRTVAQLTAGTEETKKDDAEAYHYDSTFVDVPDGYDVERVHVFSDLIHRRNHSISSGLNVNVGVDDPGTTHQLQSVSHEASESEQKAASAAVKTFTIPAGEEYDRLPITVSVRNVFGYDVVAVAELRRTDERFRAWQTDVYAAIMAAYDRRREEYQQAVEAARIGAGVRVEGENPATNRRTERTELKRGAIELLRERQLDYDAVRTPPEAEGTGRPLSFPAIDRAALDGLERDLQFFEQAFEWEQGTYVFYPYYWAEQSTWMEKLTRGDPDPKFESFLTAGAARFVVPVRLRYEPNVLRFMQTGIPFLEEGSVDDVNDPRYYDIVSELRDRGGATTGSRYTGEHWFETVPTSLVKLQGSDDLPNLITPVADLYPEYAAAQALLDGSSATDDAVTDGGDRPGDGEDE